MAQYTANENLYKWNASDTKQTTITETASNADKIDGKLNDHASQLADIAYNVKLFGAKGDGVNNDTQPFTTALNSNFPIINLPKGTFKIIDTVVVNSGVPKKIIGSPGTVISVDMATSKDLFQMYVNVEFHNITFDFNNKFVRNGLFFSEDLGMIRLKNCQFKNVKDVDSTTSTSVVFISNKGNKLDINTISLENILKKGNGIVTDSGGALTGIYVTDNLTTVTPIGGGSIRNVRIHEFHNIDALDGIIFEDTAGIYLGGLKSADVTIENVNGTNYGKRLIKAQVSDITINNVNADSNTGDSLSAVGVMDGENATLNNITVSGQVAIAIATSSKNTVINNPIIKVTPAIKAQSQSYGIMISADNNQINNYNIEADRCIVLNKTGLLKTTKISKGIVIIPATGAYGISFPNSSDGFDDLSIDDITAINNSTLAGNTTNILDTSYFTGVGEKTGKNLKIKNVTINSTCTVANGEYGFWLKYIKGLMLSNIVQNNDGTTRAWRGIYAEFCDDIIGQNIDIKAYVNVAFQTKDCNRVDISNIKSNASSTYIATLTNTTNVRFKEVDKSRIYFNDTVSQLGTLFELEYSTGLTTQRPTSPKSGQLYYDTTIKKPIWYNGTAWTDATGNTV